MSRRGENIYKRKDGRWEGRYIKNRNPDGKAVYGYVYSKTYNDTRKKLTEAKNNINSCYLLNCHSIKTIEICYRWLDDIMNNCKQSTYAKYRNVVFNHIIPELGNYDFCELNDKIINSFCNKNLQFKGLSPKTVKDMLSIVKLIVKFAKKWDYLCKCDFENIYIKVSRPAVKGLTRIQSEKLTSYLINNINYVNIGILISFYTGIRIGELCALKFDDIFIDTNIIHISKTMQRIQNFDNTKRKTDILISTPKSECSMREIPIPQFITDIILKNNLYKKDAYLLTGEKTKFIEPRTLENKFNRITSVCGIENVYFHMIRHTFASNCIEAGVDVKSLSEILGHSSVNITLNRYVHSSMHIKKMNMEKFYKFTFLSPSIM